MLLRKVLASALWRGYGVASLRVVLVACATGGDGIRSSGKVT